MSCAASGAQQQARAPSTDEGASLVSPLRSAAPRSRPRIWESGVGSGFRRGSFETGFALAAGFGNKSLGSKTSHDLALATARFGWTFAGTGTGKQWYRGSPELLVELWGGQQYAPKNGSVVGLTPLIRYNFATGSHWVPFVNGGVGVADTNIRGRDLSTGFEFNVQVGAGAHYFLREDMALTMQYRWFHLSNAGIRNPNDGTNTQMFFAGVSRFF